MGLIGSGVTGVSSEGCSLIDGDGRGHRWRVAAGVSALVLCVGLLGVSHAGGVSGRGGAASTAAVDAGAIGPRMPAVEDVSYEAEVGPVAETESALVDVDCRVRGGTTAGTGIVLGANGVVVTNNHVVAKAISISATDLGNRRRYPVVVLRRDPGHDVAVIQLVGATGLAVAPLGDSDHLRVGDGVTAVGNAGGHGGAPMVTTGVVTALGRSIVSADEYTHQSHHLSEMIEVSASVPAGDSGGALLGVSGVVGMDTAQGPGSGFAIPIDTVLSIARESESAALPADAHRWVPGPASKPVGGGRAGAVALLNGPRSG